MKRKRILLGVLLIGTAGNARAEDIPMIGLDDRGNPIQAVIPAATYERNLLQAVSALQDSTLLVLERQSRRGAWELRTVCVSFVMSFDFGNAAILGISAIPRFRLVYSNHVDPSVP